MSSAVTAFSVRIAPPAEAAMELIVTREVLGQWNAAHALERGQILLPLNGRETADNGSDDLLIAFFCPLRELSDGRHLELNIDRHLEGNRPAFLYISEARTGFGETSVLPTEEQRFLQNRYGSRACIDTYADEKEFRSKFSRQLEATLSAHAYFKSSVAGPVAALELSESARILLSEACEDFEAYIGRVKLGNSLKIQANGKQLVEQGNPESMALWESAFREILDGGYIRDAGCNGQLFQIAPKGFAFLKSMGKAPVGYIAELGGM